MRHTRRRHPQVAHVVLARDLVRDEILPEIERLDLFILGGGGILFDAEAKIYMREVALALEKSVPVVVYTEGGRSVALAVDRIIDIVEDTLDDSRRDFGDDGLLGSAVIQQRVTELLDVRRAILAADPLFHQDASNTEHPDYGNTEHGEYSHTGEYHLIGA